MRQISTATFMVALSLGLSHAQAETVNFDRAAEGQMPAGWLTGVTGQGSPHWAVASDPTAPSGPNVLRQSGSGSFPWAVLKDTRIENGSVEVKFKAISGSEDQAGGVIWRWKNGESYYVARANSLENNVALYHTTGGSRKTIRYVDAPVPSHQWHALRVEFAGKQIKVLLDGKTYINLEDEHIQGPGAVGVWTKADSITAFDDFGYTGK